ncbi:MAG: undecaprenyl-diphosphate phosphatase [Bacteroidales bacterium]|nr:undecaprenyl-diphosphate phosphatase [Bacteroidales bacterium]MDT8432264.1 undecaprenyl-diphosphate phosphatase [Bacteroidales bacterium]
MNIIEAIILGIIQGLTEFLPVSSSGHLEIGKVILGVNIEEDLGFTVLVHFATVLSTITVFFSEIRQLLAGLFKFRWNEETKYISKLLFSAIPVLIVGILLEEKVELLFSKSDASLVFVGIALLITAILLALTSFIKPGQPKKLPFSDGFIIGIAQAFAVIPGLSRSGTTIATGLLLKNNREEVAKFSFLMVLVPIIGASMLKLLDWSGTGTSNTGTLSLAVGFVAAYFSGFLACKWMINIVKKGKLIWFAIYCTLIGLIAIFFTV